MSQKPLSRTIAVAAKTLYEALKLIKNNDGHLRYREIVNMLESKLSFTDWEKHVYVTNGHSRWSRILSFYSIPAYKAGYIRKRAGEWFITDEGIKALNEMTPEELIKSVLSKYKVWRKNSVDQEDIQTEDDTVENIQEVNLEQLEENARESIKKHLYSKNPYEFQDIVGALLEAMGYFVSFIATTKGKDGGIDIIAYKDPLGVENPKIKVQVKHYTSDKKVDVGEIRSLVGVLHKDSDVGLFVTSGQFTLDAERFAREAQIHIEVIDFEKFVELWTEYYDKLSDDNKKLLPLKPIFFLGSLN